jgi:hydroxymethylpyrimidine kinase/phosphomethylpyrimidine kinase/thiamine-phosphate diphosphorylase
MSENARPIVWSVAGSDSGGGAGLQADLRAFDAFGVHGCTAVASVTAQNSVCVQRVDAVSPDLLDAQLAALADDLPPRAIKTGLLGSVDNLRVLLRWIRRLRERAPVALIVDPVWKASTGAAMADEAYRQALRDELLPEVTLLTPNRAEAAWLLGAEALTGVDAVEQASAALSALGARAVAITGGDAGGELSLDHIATPQASGWLALPRVATRHTHGTGCTFASSAAAAMALGFCEADALVLAKMATADALRHAHPAGQGAGPVRPGTGFSCDAALLPTLWVDAVPPRWRFPSTAPGTMGLYAVVDSAAWIERCAAAGVKTLQLRIKQAPHEVLDREVRESIAAAERHGARLFVNDHWQLALKHRAYGVHLGQEDLQTADLAAIAAAGLRLGLSTHAPWEVARAHAVRPSYTACGPVHATTTKDMPWVPQGEGNLAYWSRLLPAPVVGIGGLDVARAAEAARCGADGIAVLRGIVTAAQPESAIREYLDAIERARLQPPRDAPFLPHPTLPWHA